MINITAKMKRGVLLSFIILLGACNNNGSETPDGGPCSYEDKVYRATLIKTIQHGNEQYDAVFKLNEIKSFSGSDTIYYSSLNHKHYIQTSEKPRDSLVPGKEYSYFVKNIRSGHCDPHIEYITLQPYR